MLLALSGLGVNDNYSLMTLGGLHHLLASEPFTGVGASGVDFFAEPLGQTAPERRDHALLRSLRDALDALASRGYAAAFGNSSVQDDYRWGKLHRLLLSNPFGETIPPGGGFEDLVPGSLRGMARDGGLETPNRGAGGAYADGVNAFTMECASSLAPCDNIADARFVMAPGHPDAGHDGVLGYASLKGGASEDPLSPSYTSQLAKWLTVDYHRMPMNARDVRVAAERVEFFTPPKP
jgi:penicillin amidase